MSRMGVRYEDFLANRRNQAAVPKELRGSSGYFSKPTPDLDPRLFIPGTDELYPHVRRWILHTLYEYWQRKYRHPQLWSTVWIAGSGITHQWSGGRAIGDQAGDLDVLIGVDWSEFFYTNPRWQGEPNDTMAATFNEEFHRELWPQTANVVLPTGGASFEVTFYVNATGTDIRSINPYAAYNLTEGQWTVRPIDLPQDWDPHSYFPSHYWDAVDREFDHGVHLLTSYHALNAKSQLQHTGSGDWLNTLTQMHDVVRSAADLYHDIHASRRQAFNPGGEGFKDFFNFRWQAHKNNGLVPALQQLARLDADVHDDLTTICDGPLLDHVHALKLAVKASVHG